MSGAKSTESEYMLELIECIRCNNPTPRKDLYWNTTGSYTDTCKRCATSDVIIVEKLTPREIVTKLNNVTLGLPTIDGHFWVERDGKKIDPYFEEYDVVKRVHHGKRWVYLPADELTQRMMIAIFDKVIKKEFATIEEYLIYTHEYNGVQGFGFGYCHKNALAEIVGSGGTLVFGSYGVQRKDGSIFYEYGGEDYKNVKAFIKN